MSIIISMFIKQVQPPGGGFSYDLIFGISVQLSVFSEKITCPADNDVPCFEMTNHISAPGYNALQNSCKH